MGDRRLRQRAYAAATVSLFQDGAHVGDYVAKNLSASGALLVGGAAVAPGTRCSTIVRVLGEYVLELDASVVRLVESRRNFASLAVKFLHGAATNEAAIQASVLKALARAEEGAVLIVNCTVADLISLAESVLATGRRPILAFTPLEAMSWLYSQDAAIDAIIVGSVNNVQESQAFLGFVRDEFPTIRRILVGENIRQAHPVDRLALGEAQLLLVQPWTPSVMDFHMREDLTPRSGPS